MTPIVPKTSIGSNELDMAPAKTSKFRPATTAKLRASALKKNTSASAVFFTKVGNMTWYGSEPLSVFFRDDRAYHSGRELS